MAVAGLAAASTLFKVGTAVATASSVLSGVAGFAQAQSESRRLRQQADNEQSAGRANELRLRRQQSLQLGSQRAMMAGGGGVMGGSNLDIVADQAAEAELNALLQRYNTDTRVDALRRQASATRTGGFLQLGGAALGAGATFLGGASAYQQLFGGAAGTAALSNQASQFAIGSSFAL